MKLTELFSNEFATVEADREKNYIQVTWLTHVADEELRKVLLKASELARTEGLYKWLFDMRKLNFTTMGDQSWSANTLFPTFDLQWKHCLACVAMPQSVDLISGNVVRQAIERQPELSDKIELQLFVSIEAAREWLFNQEQSAPEAAGT